MVKRETATNNRGGAFRHFINYVTSIDRVWLTTWIFIYFGFIILDAFTHICYGSASFSSTFILGSFEFTIPVIAGGTFIGTTIIKYTGVVLNLVYAHRKFPTDHLLQIALGFTLLADTILCINSVSAAGVLVFCFAQYFHASRFASAHPRFFTYWSAMLVGILFCGHLTGIPIIFVVGTVYAISIFTNLYFSYHWYIKTAPLSLDDEGLSPATKREIIASACGFYGFALFVCCDLCVALSFFSYIQLLPPAFYAPANYFSWVFYYVSQLLIANSSTLTKKPRKSRIFAQKQKL